MKSGPNETATLSYNQMKEYIDDIVIPGNFQSVVFTGGECTRLGADLLEIIAYCTTEGILTRIVTNAEWAVNDVSTSRYITNLRKAGLSELNISYDDFHAVWIPIENITRLFRLSKSKGFTSVVLAVGAGPRSKITPEYMESILGETIPRFYDEDGHKAPLPTPSPDGTTYLLSNTSIYRIGRGKHLRKEYINKPLSTIALKSACPARNRNPVVFANGELAACCGINAAGNRILEFNTTNNDIRSMQQILIEAIGEAGPEYLRQLASKAGVAVPERDVYGTICEICEDITTHDQTVDFLFENISQIAETVNGHKALKDFFCKYLTEANIDALASHGDIKDV
jgi:hypothetical protein